MIAARNMLTFQYIKFDQLPRSSNINFLGGGHIHANTDDVCTAVFGYNISTNCSQGRTDGLIGPRSISWTGPFHNIKVGDTRENQILIQQEI